MHKKFKKTQKANIVVGLGYGDEGKGLTVDWLCENSSESIVVRFSGGQQAGHTVHRDRVKHTFSNYGAGTLLGVDTYFSEHTTFYPVTILREKSILLDKGVSPSNVIYHPMARVTTPWDVFHNRSCKITRDNGTCGLGIGATMKRNEGTYQLRAIDLLHTETFESKLKQIQKYYETTLDFKKKVSMPDFKSELKRFKNAVKKIDWIVRDYDYLTPYKELIFEGSQGVMLDKDHGVFPNVTYANTTSKNAMDICDKLDIQDRTVWGITRAYSTRHGVGDGTYEGETIKLKDTHHETNLSNRFQGDFYVTKLDYDRLNYAIHVERLYSLGYEFNMMVTCNNQVPNGESFVETNVIIKPKYTYYSYGVEDDIV